MAGPRKVPIGQLLEEFPGRSFNILVDDFYRRQSLLPRENAKRPGGGQTLTVKAKNLTDATLLYGHCVQIEGLAVSVTDNPNQVYGRSLLEAIKPGDGNLVMGVATGPIADDSVGTFIIAGPAWLRCNVVSTSHEFVALVPDQGAFSEVAESGDSGVPILAKEDDAGTGEMWVLALLGTGSSQGTSAKICRALEFIGIGGPLPYWEVPVAIGQVWGGLAGTEDGYDWQNGDDPADLALWGVGDVQQISQETEQLEIDGEPVEIDGEPVMVTSLVLGDGFKAINCTNHWIFAGALCLVEGNRITWSDSPQVVYEDYEKTGEGTGTSTYYAADGQRQNNPPYTDDLEIKRDELEMPSSFVEFDPIGARDSKISVMEIGEIATFTWVTGRTTAGSAAGSQLQLRSIYTGGGGSGSPGPTGPEGPPGEDGLDGAITAVLLAKVDETDDVDASLGTFNFKDASVLQGTYAGGPTGTVTNCDAAWVNEQTLIILTDGVQFQAIAPITNWISFTVNQSGGVDPADATFPIDGIAAIVGSPPGDATPTVVNTPAAYWRDNEPGIAFQRSDGDWQAVKTRNFTTYKATVNEASGVASTDTTFDWDTGRNLDDTTAAETSGTVKNTWGYSFDDNEDFWLVRDNGEWFAFKILSNDYFVVKGNPTANVTSGSTTFTLGSLVAVKGKLPTANITVTCEPKIHAITSDTVYARFDLSVGSTDLTRWSTGDAGNWLHIARGRPGFDATKNLLLGYKASGGNLVQWDEIDEWLKLLTGYVHANDQSIGHDVSTDPEWQDDGDECPEAP
jgi:hypothetical protein